MLVKHAHAALLPGFRERVGVVNHDLAISADSLRVKSRLHQATLTFPEVAVAGEQPQPDDRTHDLLGNSRLIILVGIGHEHVMNPIWMVDHDDSERPEVKRP